MSRNTALRLLLAAICAVAVLLGFGQLVQLSVEQGDRRRAATRERQAAAWRCALPAASLERSDCRAALP
ncbi:hypothetical protein [Rubrivivax gelatinosus]|uniref:General secretion pathway protein GspL n=1 Tax=Rubrivivax gelatinosus TaxID=28068 RepID=A0ABS1DUC5_RUBGE|nr:hypothetical protein [Rubrivivax gelatinosus]MBK1713616.1 hypothetical protein [Rubrivivax gelatinosus]